MYGAVPDNTTRVDVTLYTQLTVSRLLNLLRITRTWAGPISAVIGGNEKDMDTLREWLNNAPEELKQRKNIWIHGVHHTGVSIFLNYSPFTW